MSGPYFEEHRAKTVTLILRYQCHSSAFSCLTRQRIFNREDHAKAIALLQKKALPGEILTFGIMGPGFIVVSEENQIYTLSGLFVQDYPKEKVVFGYTNPFL